MNKLFLPGQVAILRLATNPSTKNSDRKSGTAAGIGTALNVAKGCIAAAVLGVKAYPGLGFPGLGGGRLDH